MMEYGLLSTELDLTILQKSIELKLWLDFLFCEMSSDNQSHCHQIHFQDYIFLFGYIYLKNIIETSNLIELKSSYAEVSVSLQKFKL